MLHIGGNFMNQTHIPSLDILVSKDSVYQDLLRQCQLIEPEFIRIQRSLSEDDRAIVDYYISLCEELDHRKLSLALTL